MKTTKKPINNLVELKAYLELAPEIKYREEIKSFKKRLKKELRKVIKSSI